MNVADLGGISSGIAGIPPTLILLHRHFLRHSQLDEHGFYANRIALALFAEGRVISVPYFHG
jgi:hypothetical protein